MIHTENNGGGWREEFRESFTTWESWTTTDKNRISSQITPQEIEDFISKVEQDAVSRGKKEERENLLEKAYEKSFTLGQDLEEIINP